MAHLWRRQLDKCAGTKCGNVGRYGRCRHRYGPEKIERRLAALEAVCQHNAMGGACESAEDEMALEQYARGEFGRAVFNRRAYLRKRSGVGRGRRTMDRICGVTDRTGVPHHSLCFSAHRPRAGSRPGRGGWVPYFCAERGPASAQVPQRRPVRVLQARPGANLGAAGTMGASAGSPGTASGAAGAAAGGCSRSLCRKLCLSRTRNDFNSSDEHQAGTTAMVALVFAHHTNGLAQEDLSLSGI